MVLEPTIGLILVELFQIGPLYTHYRGKREAEAKGDAGPREERSYGHGKAQPGPGNGTHHIWWWCLEKLKVNGAFFKVHFKRYFAIAHYNS